MRNCRFLAGILTLALSPVVFGETNWETYLDYPTSENAALVQNAEYSDSISFPEHLYQDLWLLEVQVISCDREAVRLAYRLLRESDGHYSETLDIILGRLIRIDPVMFLEELRDHRKEVVRLDALLGNQGNPYIDRFGAKRYETEERISALESVTIPGLREIRDECLIELKDKLERLKNSD